MRQEYMKWGTFGLLAGAATPFMLKLVSKVVTTISGGALSVDLQSVSVTGTVSGALNTGLSTYAQKVWGLVPTTLSLPDILWSAVGGALVLMLGLFAAKQFKLLTGSKLRRVVTVMVLGGVAAGLILGGFTMVPTLPAVIQMVVNATFLGLIYIWVDKAFKLNLVP